MVVALNKVGELTLSQIKAITDKLPFNLGIMSNNYWISCFIDGELWRFRRLKAIVCAEEMVRARSTNEKPKGQGVKGCGANIPYGLGWCPRAAI